MEMITSGMDHSLQYIPQLTTHLSSLHVGNGPYMTPGGHGHHATYPTLYAPNQSAAVMPALSLATESDHSASAAASPDEPYSYGTSTILNTVS